VEVTKWLHTPGKRVTQYRDRASARAAQADERASSHGARRRRTLPIYERYGARIQVLP